MKVLEKAVISKTAPEHKDVLWIDTKEATPELKVWNRGRFEKIGRGSGDDGGGGDSGPSNVVSTFADVTFVDYDGTIVDTYTAEEFAQLKALPKNPSHEGLISQGWNFTLEEAQNHVNNYGKLVIGQMYTTVDGKTRLYVTIPYATEGRTIALRLVTPTGNSVEIDWGDSSNKETVATSGSCSIDHTYTQTGRSFIITITRLTTEQFLFLGGGTEVTPLIGTTISDRNILTKVEIGWGIKINAYCFIRNYSLESITLPNDLGLIGEQAFTRCFKLPYVTIPKSPNMNGIETYAFSVTKGLVTISIPIGVGTEETYTIGMYSFYQSGIEFLALPEGATTGQNTCYSCKALKEVSLAENVSLGMGTFRDTALQKVTIRSRLENTTIFMDCITLSEATFSENPTKIPGSLFSNCESLREIGIPEGVATIGNSAFKACTSLLYVVIPSTVESIGTEAFSGCTGLEDTYIYATTPPTLTNANTFTSTSRNTIHVPAASVNDYKSASYWSVYAGKIVGDL